MNSTLIKLMLFLAILIAILIILELIFRFANPIDYFSHSNSWATEMFHHSPKPGKFNKTYANQKISYQINSFGIRDAEYQIPKPQNTYRILIIGDSFVYGEGVDIENVWVKILENKLQHFDFPQNIEIINGGIWGYSPILEYLFFKEKLIHLQPDLVLQCIFSNDISEDFIYSNIAEYDLNGHVIRIPHAEKPRFFMNQTIINKQNWFFKNSYLIKYLTWIGERLFPQNPGFTACDILTDSYAHCKSSAPNWEEHYSRSIFYITATANLNKQNSISYIATLLPSVQQLQSDRLFNILSAAAAQHAFSFWNLLAEFQSHLTPDHYHKLHGHLTEEGNQILANIIYDQFVNFLSSKK